MTPTLNDPVDQATGPRDLLEAMSSLQALHQTAQEHCAELVRQRDVLQQLLAQPRGERVNTLELGAIAAELDLVRDALFGEQHVGESASIEEDVAGDAATMARSMCAMVEQVQQRQRDVASRLAGTDRRLSACGAVTA